MKCILLLLMMIGFRVSADSGYFEIRDVEVKQKGSNSLIAKQKALLEANRFAFKKIIEDVSKGQCLTMLKSISDQQIQSCIYDYSIDQEKFSELFYIGKISYRFSKNKILALLKSHGIHTDIQNEENKIIKLAVYLSDFIHRANELNKLEVIVEKFSDTKVVFNINKRYINDFRKLCIKYARLI